MQVQARAQKKAPSPSVAGLFEGTLRYTQSGEFWQTKNDIEGAHGDLKRISSILDRKYGTVEHASARVGGKWSDQRWDLSLAVDALAVGRVQNPVVPEIRVRLLYGATLGAGWRTPLSAGGTTQARLGLLLSSGAEKRVDAYSTDLIDKLPVRAGTYRAAALEQSLESSAPLAKAEWKGGLRLRESFFSSTVSGSAMDSSDTLQHSYFRWKMNHELLWRVDGSPWKLGPEAILGPEPVPGELESMQWDHANRLISFPELGALFGGGLVASSGSQKETIEARISTGIYAGYFGARASVRYRSVVMNAGSWVTEASAAYRTLGNRVNEISLGLRL